ncbi:error-prone DNA polymerase [Falsirhodobacter algicola]|uniref:error-prone DNA polymerase n=1 Tax=Falsirhodobacter algicola TaxID=2692330 RepID=UPI002013A901|nr:error-prone DNA polymerase [Falsirhodobacter algicola]
MARVISVFLPMWPVDRLRRQEDSPSDRPLVLAGRIGNRRVLTAVDAGAAGLGVTVGMPVSKAQALVQGLRIEAANPEADLASLERLAFWILQRIAPIVAVDPPDGIVIDSTGADHLHGGEEALLEALTGRLALSGVTARAAVADTWGAAHALARFGGDLHAMPPEALRLPPATVAGLRDMGFATIGDLMAAPRAPLTRRFGSELIRRIDQMFGDAAEPIDALRPPGLIETRRAFAEPIGAAETIARYINKLVVALCAILDERGLGVRRLDLICHRVDRERQTVRIGLAVPQRDPQRLTRLLCDRIPTIAPGFGIEIMTLTATITEPLAARQTSTLAPEAPDLSGLIDTLAGRVGHRAIYRIAPVASDVPERSVRRIPALSEPTAEGYVLGITSIDPGRNDLLFERFISEERREPPDIDVDFEHERREEVIQWIYKTYGRTHAALTAVVTRYRAKGALRDVGKAMGLPEDLISAMSASIWAWSEEGLTDAQLEELNLNPSDRRLRLTMELAQQLMGAPRHLSQHPGGFVLTHDRLDDLVPIEPAAMEDRQIIEWDKDNIDALKFMKVDVLALGMLTCMAKGLKLIADHKGAAYDLATIPAEDPRTYAMIRKADTLGTFQIESRAQMAMLPRLKPRTYYDLVVQVAIVRPGPIQGDMVHPYLRRRAGLEAVEYPKPELEKVLGKTLGVPLFQEQAMRVAIECAGFTPGEADMLRKSMATFKFTGGVSAFRDKLIDGMVARGYEAGFAERTFRQLEGFGSYGFPESHAASFALIAYASSWLKCWHPDAFCAALLNSQPMGFYAPAQIVRDARDHGVEVRPVCVNVSEWDCTLEGGAVRLGLRMVKGLAEAHAAAIARTAPFTSVEDLWRRARVPAAALTCIAQADGFHSFGLSRRQAVWAIKGLPDTDLPLFAAAESAEPAVPLRPMTAGREVVEDYSRTGLSLRQHPVAFLRGDLAKRRILTCAEAMALPNRHWAEVAGLVLVRQRPSSAKGTMFITLEDETGIANLVVWPKIFEANRRTILAAGMIAARGRIQREGEVVHFVVQHLANFSAALGSVGSRGAFPLPIKRGDEFYHGSPTPDPRHPKPPPPGGPKPRHMFIRDLHLDTIRMKTRDFR